MPSEAREAARAVSARVRDRTPDACAPRDHMTRPAWPSCRARCRPVPRRRAGPCTRGFGARPLLKRTVVTWDVVTQWSHPAAGSAPDPPACSPRPTLEMASYTGVANWLTIATRINSATGGARTLRPSDSPSSMSRGFGLICGDTRRRRGGAVSRRSDAAAAVFFVAATTRLVAATTRRRPGRRRGGDPGDDAAARRRGAAETSLGLSTSKRRARRTNVARVRRRRCEAPSELRISAATDEPRDAVAPSPRPAA